jgi:hypothetical protein
MIAEILARERGPGKGPAFGRPGMTVQVDHAYGFDRFDPKPS